MNLIPSFTIDHTKLKSGIYISRQDEVGNGIVTTYDIRMTIPNEEPAVSPEAMHTIEHIVATFLRNNEEWKDQIIYWGPMGCLTGSYLIMKGDRKPEEIRQLIIDAFQFVIDFEGEIPGAKPEECGNYLLQNLPMAKWEAKRYVNRLITDFHSKYDTLSN